MAKNKSQEAAVAADHSTAAPPPAMGKIRVRIRPNNTLTMRPQRGITQLLGAGEWVEIDAKDLPALEHAVETEEQVEARELEEQQAREAAEAQGDDPLFLQHRESMSKQLKARKEADEAFVKMQLGMPRDQAFEAVRAEQRKKL